jgi:peptidoglycan hydrolase-like protein with peptidoglycan-binding domain
MGQGPQRDQGAQRDRAQQREQRGEPDRMGRDDRRDAQPSQRRQTQGQAGTRQDRAGAAQGEARGRVTLNTQQRTRIRQTVLAGRNVPRVDRVNFSLSVGVAVPSHIHLVAVPPALIEIHPAWRGHMYFVVDDDIVIVDDSRRIVSVVSVGPSQASVGVDGDAMAMDLSEAEIREVQHVLIERGFYDGEVDGVFGPRTRAALITFQRRQGLAVTGRIDTRTVAAMNLSGRITVREGTQTRQRSTVGQGRDGAQQRQRSTVGQGRDGSQQRQGRDTQRSQGRDMQQSRGRQDMNGQQQPRRSTTGQQPRATTGQGNQQPRANQRMQPGQNERSGSTPTTGQSGGDQPRANQRMPSGQSGMSGSPARSTTGSATTGSSTTGQGSDQPSARMPRDRNPSSPAGSGGQAR